MTKVIIAILLFILFLGLYIYLNHFIITKKEGFEPNVFLDNQIRDSFNKSIEDIQKITPYNEINIDDIKKSLAKELKIGDEYAVYDELYDQRENGQDGKIKDLEGAINKLNKSSLFMGLEADKLTEFRAIKSLQNSQPLNLTPLSNNKYLININGQCLENNSLNKTSIKPCNIQDPNQYFNLNFVSNENDYRKYTLGDIYNIDPQENYKYPFVMMQSESGNCLSNNDSHVSVQPCDKTITQRWNPSTQSIVCGTSND